MNTESVCNALQAGIACASLATLLGSTTPAFAAEPPLPKNIRIIVPFAPGASTDLLARQLGGALGAKVGSTIIVDNRPGAGSVIGTTLVAKGTPDASNLLLATNSFAITAALQSQLPYDAATDFAPVAVIMTVPLILAVPSTTPYKSPGELIAAARAQPGVLNYASAGIGSSSHIAGELLNTSAKVQITHVAYKGAALAITDLIAGRTQMMLSTYTSLAGQLQAGKLRPLAVTSSIPSAASPDLPMLSATLPGYVFDGWFGIITTGGTPAPVVEYLNREIRGISTSEQFARFIQQERAEPSQLSAPAFTSMVRNELAQWKKIVTERNIKPE